MCVPQVPTPHIQHTDFTSFAIQFIFLCYRQYGKVSPETECSAVRLLYMYRQTVGKLLVQLIFYCLFLMHAHGHVCGGQRITRGTQLSSSTVWVLEIKPRLSWLVRQCLQPRSWLPAQYVRLFSCIVCVCVC